MPFHFLKFLKFDHQVKLVQNSSPAYRARRFGYNNWKQLWLSETRAKWPEFCSRRSSFIEPRYGVIVHIQGTVHAQTTLFPGNLTFF